MSEWRSRAACSGADPELFFGIPSHPAAPEAIELCRDCQVRNDCLEWALDTRDAWAVLGGLTPDQRRLMLRRRAKAAARQQDSTECHVTLDGTSGTIEAAPGRRANDGGSEGLAPSDVTGKSVHSW